MSWVMVWAVVDEGGQAAHGEAGGWDNVSVARGRRAHPLRPCGDTWYYTSNSSKTCKRGVVEGGRGASAPDEWRTVEAWTWARGRA